MHAVEYDVDGTIAVLTVQYPPVNALSAAVRKSLDKALERARDDDAIAAVVILGGGTTFIAGADITAFGTENSQAKPSFEDIQRSLEDFPKPTVAAIHGTVLGGGLELALAANARVAIRSAKVGLPEVNLGLLPGAGGTQRLPRLTGVSAALDLITTGKHIGVDRALALGIIDAIVDDVRVGAIRFAREMAASGMTLAPVIARNEKVIDIDPRIFAEARQSVAKKARGKIAPMVIIDCIEAACSMSAKAGLAFETQKFRELYANDQRAALMHYSSSNARRARFPAWSQSRGRSAARR
jgi:3-hydroxyacyl-CoA dehydrogenase